MDYLFQCPAVRGKHTHSPFQKLIKHHLKVLKLLPCPEPHFSNCQKPSHSKSHAELMELHSNTLLGLPCYTFTAIFLNLIRQVSLSLAQIPIRKVTSYVA